MAMNAWLIAAMVTAGTAEHAPSPNAARLLGQVQTTYRTGGDLTAAFTQNYIDRLRPNPRVESGHLWAKKDGRVRWRYEQPNVKEFVFDGKRAHFYEPDNAQVTVFDNFVDSPLLSEIRCFPTVAVGFPLSVNVRLAFFRIQKDPEFRSHPRCNLTCSNGDSLDPLRPI